MALKVDMPLNKEPKPNHWLHNPFMVGTGNLKHLYEGKHAINQNQNLAQSAGGAEYTVEE